MPVSSLDALPEAFVSETALSSAISRGVRQGKLRKLGSRLYTRNFTDAPEAIVRRNLWQLVGAYAPGALIADRTALENAPAGDGSIFLVAERKREIELPGVTLRPRPGHPPLPGDRPFVGGLFLSSTARAFLENMRPSRGRSYGATGARTVRFGCQDEPRETTNVDRIGDRSVCRPRGRCHAFRRL